jgi:hypothetical protein
MNACEFPTKFSLLDSNRHISFRGLLEFEKTIFVLVNLMDVVMTYLLLNTGSFYESNPIANFILDGWGMAGMTAFKLVTIGIVLAIANIVAVWRVETSRKLLYFGTAIVGTVVAYSSYLLLNFQGAI